MPPAPGPTVPSLLSHARWRLGRPQAFVTALALGVGLLIGALALDRGIQNARDACDRSPACVDAPGRQRGSAPGGLSRRIDPHGRLPAAARQRYRLLWVARAGAQPQATNALFGVTHSGSASVNVPGNLAGVRQVMVTAEPLGGSPHPTSAPVVVAVLRSS